MQSLYKCRRGEPGLKNVEDISLQTILALVSTIIFSILTALCAGLCLYGCFLKGKPAKCIQEYFQKLR
jgi:hypothetical protein